MGNQIHKSRLAEFLKADCNINKVIGKKEIDDMKRLLFANRTNWTKITDLPDFVYHQFEMRMREECFVTEYAMKNPPSEGPHILFEENGSRLTVKIDNTLTKKGADHYRKCLAVVAFYTGIKGGIIEPVKEKGVYNFTDEDWIMISMAARYCLMPGKYIQKVLLLTKMYAEQGSMNEGGSLLSAFVENLTFQTNIPEWAVWCRLWEHSFSNPEIAELLPPTDIDKLVAIYRDNAHYTDPLVA